VPYYIASSDGLLRVEDNGRVARLADGGFRHVVPGDDDGAAVALDDDGQLWDADDDGAAPFGSLPEAAGLSATCVLASGDDVWVGTVPAALFKRDGDDIVRVDGFDAAPGHDRWTAPRGSAGVRSLDIDDDDTLWANVHVGGILRSADGGRSWQPTLEPSVDVHQVYAVPGRAGTVVAACGDGGLATTTDGGTSWSMSTAGLTSTYCRAVVVADDTVLLSSQDGPGGGSATLHRRPLDDVEAPFVPCAGGLPDGIPGRIDTHMVAAWDEDAVIVLPSGDLYVSRDAGYAWRRLATSLGDVRAVVIV
jgi:hypothetical protein